MKIHTKNGVQVLERYHLRWRIGGGTYEYRSGFFYYRVRAGEKKMPIGPYSSLDKALAAEEVERGSEIGEFKAPRRLSLEDNSVISLPPEIRDLQDEGIPVGDNSVISLPPEIRDLQDEGIPVGVLTTLKNL